VGRRANVLPFGVLRPEPVPKRHHCRPGCLSGGSLRFGVLMCARYVGLFGCPTARHALVALRRNLRCYRSPFPVHFRKRFILPYASRLFRVLPSRACPASPDVEPLQWGCHPSSRRQSAASLPPGSNLVALPSATFLTPSTVFSATNLVGLFHPTATSRVRSPGGSPLVQPSCFVSSPCPLVVSDSPLPAVAHQRHVPSPRPQGLVRTRIRCLRSGV